MFTINRLANLESSIVKFFDIILNSNMPLQLCLFSQKTNLEITSVQYAKNVTSTIFYLSQRIEIHSHDSKQLFTTHCINL